MVTPPTAHRRPVGGSPFRVLASSFALLTTGPRPLALPGEEVAGLPDRAVPLDELRARLLHPSTPYEVRDEAIDALIRRAQAEGGAWMVGLCGVLLPGLRKAVAPLAGACPDSLWDLEAEMLAGLVAAVGRATPGQARPAARLTWAARRAAERVVHAALAERVHPGRAPVSAPPPRPYGHPDLILARAVDEEVISATDAAVIGATRLEGVSLEQAARRLGTSYVALDQRRHRAEWALRTFIEEGGASEPPGPRPSRRSLLAAAVRAGVIDAEAAELIRRTRIEGLTLRAAAERAGRSYDSAWRKRAKAEAALSRRSGATFVTDRPRTPGSRGVDRPRRPVRNGRGCASTGKPTPSEGGERPPARRRRRHPETPATPEQRRTP